MSSSRNERQAPANIGRMKRSLKFLMLLTAIYCMLQLIFMLQPVSKFVLVNKDVTNLIRQKFIRSAPTSQLNNAHVLSQERKVLANQSVLVEASHKSGLHDNLKSWKPHKIAISTGNPLATAAGYATLKAGGSAADATIAAAAVLSVVEPYSGGLGGDFMALIHDPYRPKPKITVLNGSGRVPKLAASLSQLQAKLKEAGEGMDIPKRGPLSALSLPGAAAAWCRLHSTYGRLPWNLILQPAINLAMEGFVVSNHTAEIWKHEAWDVIHGRGKERLSKESKREFLELYTAVADEEENEQLKKRTPRAGDRFYNPMLASTLRNLATHGCGWFYSVAAKDIAEHVTNRGGLGLNITPDESTAWKEEPTIHASWEKPLSAIYMKDDESYEILTAGENSYAGADLMVLKILNGIKNVTVRPNARDLLIHYQISAKRLLCAKGYKKYSQKLVDDNKFLSMAAKQVQEGAFETQARLSTPSEKHYETGDSEGLVVRDAAGLTISMLQSLGLPFGSGIVVPSLGISVHGRGYGFSTNITAENVYSRGERPCAMPSPFLIYRHKKFWIAASIQGREHQPNEFAQIFLNMVELNNNALTAISWPRFREEEQTSNILNRIIQFDHSLYESLDKVQLSSSEIDRMITGLKKLGYNAIYESKRADKDSHFCIAQLIIDHSYDRELTDAAGTADAVSIEAVSDLSRKPGLALAGESTSFVSFDPLPAETIPRGMINESDFFIIAHSFSTFLRNLLNDWSIEQMAFFLGEGSGSQDVVKQPAPLNIPIFGYCTPIHASVTNAVVKKTNVLLPNLYNISDPVNGIICASLETCDNLSHGLTPFPVGSIPVMRADSYILSLNEDVSSLDLLMRTLGVAEYLPNFVDSRDKEFKFCWENFKTKNITMMPWLRSRGIDFPVVIKAAKGMTSGMGVFIALDEDQLISDLMMRNRPFIFQESIKGREYTLHFMAYYGQLVSAECFQSKFPNMTQESLFIKGSRLLNTYASKPSNDFLGCQEQAIALTFVKKIVAGLVYNGIGCFNYKMNINGTIKIIEMNPRLCCGIAVPSYWYKVARFGANWLNTR